MGDDTNVGSYVDVVKVESMNGTYIANYIAQTKAGRQVRDHTVGVGGCRQWAVGTAPLDG